MVDAAASTIGRLDQRFKMRSKRREFMKRNTRISQIVSLMVTSMISAQSYSAEASPGGIGTPGAPSIFSKDDVEVVFEATNGEMQLVSLTGDEMRSTEGAVAPLVAVGVMAAGRFIVHRWVTQRMAQRMVSHGSANIMAPTRSIAVNIAGRNNIREFHPGPGIRFTHYHPDPRNGSHIWYGVPR